MNQKRTFHYYRPGNLSGLELTLNAMSRGGWQAVKPGGFVQRYAQGESCGLHRFDYCGDRLGSAGEIDETLLGWLDAAHRFTTERTMNHART